jgi:hypothetical protein
MSPIGYGEVADNLPPVMFFLPPLRPSAQRLDLRLFSEVKANERIGHWQSNAPSLLLLVLIRLHGGRFVVLAFILPPEFI